MFWLTAGTGGGGLVELRGLSLDCLWRGESNASLLDHKEAGASQPAPKQVIKSANSQKKSCLALCDLDQIIILRGSLLLNRTSLQS